MAAALLMVSTADPTPWAVVRLGGFTKDGGYVDWTVETAERDRSTYPVLLEIVTDRDGKIVKTCREGQKPGDDAPADAAGLWARSPGQVECERWASTHPLISPVTEGPLAAGKRIAGPREALALSVTSDRDRCPTHILVATLGSLSGAVAEDPCQPGEERSRGVGSSVQVGWSPDGERAAVGWMASRHPPPGIEDEEWQSGRAYLVIVSRRTLASVDLLDAGAATGLDALASKLARAGFRVGHRGNASTRRKQTEIYFGPGFEPEARELAKLLGLPDGAAQPVTWKTPYAMTVAAGGP